MAKDTFDKLRSILAERESSPYSQDRNKYQEITAQYDNDLYNSPEYKLGQDINNAKSDMWGTSGIGGLVERFSDNFFSTLGNTITGLDLSDTTNQFGKEMTRNATLRMANLPDTVEVPHDKGVGAWLNYFTDINRGAIPQVANVGGSALSMLIPTALTMIPAGRVAGMAMKVGKNFPAVGRAVTALENSGNARQLLKDLGMGAISGQYEALAEKGATIDELEQMGLPHDEAVKQANEVYKENSALLTATNAVESALANPILRGIIPTFNVVDDVANGVRQVGRTSANAQALRRFANMVPKPITTTGKVAGSIAGNMALNGYEEGVQNQIQSAHTPTIDEDGNFVWKDYQSINDLMNPYQWSDESIRAAEEGAVGAGGLALLGHGAGGISRRIRGQQPNDDNESTDPWENAFNTFKGQRMKNGDRGCVEAVTKIGAEAGNTWIGSQLEQSVVDGDTLASNAQRDGLAVIAFDPANVERGDIILYNDTSKEGEDGLNVHSVIADGNGGIWGNSSSQHQVTSQNSYDMGDNLVPATIIKASAFNDGVVADNEFEDEFDGEEDTASDFDTFMAKIGMQESGGNYDAVNADSGASGKYQIMPDNWQPWAVEAGLDANAEMTPENQEIVARHKLKQYYDKYGEKGALVAWYAGEGNAERYVKGETTDVWGREWTAPQDGAPSIQSYVDEALAQNVPNGGRKRKSRKTPNVNTNSTGNEIQSDNATLDDYLKLFDDGNNDRMTYADYERLINNASDDEVMANANKAVMDYTQEGNLDSFTQLTEMIGDDDVDGLRELAKEHARAITIDEQSPNDSEIDDTADVQNEPIKTFDFTEAINGLMEIANNGIQEQQVVARQALQSNAPLFVLNTYKQLTSGAPLEQADMDKMNAVLNSPAYQDRVKNQLAGMYNSGNFDGVRTVLNQIPDNIPSQAEINQQSMGDNRETIEQTQRELQERTNRRQVNDNAQQIARQQAESLNNNAPLTAQEQATANSVLNSADGVFAPQIKNELFNALRNGDNAGVRRVINGVPDNIPSQADVHQQSMAEIQESIGNARKNVNRAMAEKNLAGFLETLDEVEKEFMEFLDNLFYETGKGFIDVANGLISDVRRSRSEEEREVLINAIEGLATIAGKAKEYEARRNELRRESGVGKAESNRPVRQEAIPSEAGEIAKAYGLQLKERLKQNNVPISEQAIDRSLNSENQNEVEHVVGRLESIAERNNVPVEDIKENKPKTINQQLAEARAEKEELLGGYLKYIDETSGQGVDIIPLNDGSSRGVRSTKNAKWYSEWYQQNKQKHGKMSKKDKLDIAEQMYRGQIETEETAVVNRLSKEEFDKYQAEQKEAIEKLDAINAKIAQLEKAKEETKNNNDKKKISPKKGTSSNAKKKNAQKTTLTQQESREGVESETRKETPSSKNKPALNRKSEGQNSKAEMVKESGETATVSKAEIVGENIRDDFKLSRKINDAVRTSLITIDQLVLSGHSQKDIERYVKNTLNLIDRESNLTDGEKQIIKDMLRSRSKIAINKAVKQIKNSNTKLAVDTSREGIQKQAKINREKQLELVKTEFPTATNIVQNEDSISFNLNDEKVRVDYVDRVIATEERKQAYRRDYGKEYTDDVSILGDTQTIDGEQVITLLNKLGNEDTLSHEAFHLAFRTALTKAQQKILLDKYGNEEAVAEAYRKLMNKSNARGTMFDMTSSIGRLFQKIWNFANSLFNVFNNGCMLHDAESIMYAIADGSIYELNEENEKGIVAFLHPALLAAWHGTPHKFDSFSTDFVGSGEGSQVHGWGIYFALNKDVADSYTKITGGRSITINGKEFGWHTTTSTDLMQHLNESEYLAGNALYWNQGNVEEAISSLEKNLIESTSQETKKIYSEAINSLKIGDISSLSYLYQVDIPSTDTMLREDKPFSEQPKQVQDALEKMWKDYKDSNTYSYKQNDDKYDVYMGDKLLDTYDDEELAKQAVEENTNSTHIKNLSNFIDGREILSYVRKNLYYFTHDYEHFSSDKGASLWLNKYGIEGISYDGVRDGECCVVFNDKAVKILERNGEPVNNADEHGVKLRVITNADNQIKEVRKKYEGTEQWMKAPNGKPTNLTEQQWLQVRTPNFKEWFGDWENDPKNASKVVDENGEPLVVYHGTPLGGFEVFNRELNYFTADKEYADRYQDPGASSDYVKGVHEELGKAMTYPVFLNIRKPFDTRKAKERKIFEKEFYRQWGNGAPLSEKGLPDWTDSDDFREFFEENDYDYDGLLLDEGGVPTEDGNVKSRGISYVAFNSNQIKSATDNSGDFSTENDNIKYSRAVSNPNSAENLKKNGDTDTRLDKLPKVDYTKLNKTEKDIMKFGKALGVPVHFVTHYDPNYRGVFTHNGEIFINRKATVPAKDIFVHEFVHWLRASGNEAIYDSLSACLENINGVSHAKRLSEYRKFIFNGERMTNDEIIEEIICDAISYTATANKMFNAMNDINPTMAERTLGYFKTVWDKFCNAVGYKLNKPIGQQKLPNFLNANELAKVNAVINQQLANLKDADGKAVFVFKDGKWTTAKSGKELSAEFNSNPVSDTVPKKKTNTDVANNIQKQPSKPTEETASSDTEGMFKRANKELLKKMGFKVDADKNVDVVRKSTNPQDINWLNRVFNSPSFLARYNKLLAPFVSMAKSAVEKQEKLRYDFRNSLNEVEKILGYKTFKNDSNYKENKDNLNKIMILGDTEGKEYNAAELQKMGYNEQVIKAYLKMRKTLNDAWEMLNNITRRMKFGTSNLTEGELADLKKNNPFLEVISISSEEDKNGRKRYTYKYPSVTTITEHLSKEDIDNLKKNEDVKVISSIQINNNEYIVKYAQRRRMGKIKGYVPHMFHEWSVVEVDKDGKILQDDNGNSKFIRTFSSMNEAIKYANGLDKNSNYRVMPKLHEVMGASERSMIVQDYNYLKIMDKVVEDFTLTPEEAVELMNSNIKTGNRGRFLGNLMKRKGVKGYEEDMMYATYQYLNQVGRYVALDPFKRLAYSLYEKQFGKWGDEKVYNGELGQSAKWAKNYINAINGVPTDVERNLNNVLHALGVGRDVAGGRPAIWLAHAMTYPMTIAKLGLCNVSSALLNITQLANLFGAMGDMSKDNLLRVANNAVRMYWQAWRNPDSQTGKLLWQDLGLRYQLGMDVAGGYSKSEVDKVASMQGALSKLAGKSMFMFRGTDSFGRGVTLLTAYQKARDKGKTHVEAVRYAKMINDRVNFDYSVADANGIYNQLGVVANVFLQFKKYPMKQYELFYDIFKEQKALNKDKSFTNARALGALGKYMMPYMALSGIAGVPFIGLAGALLGFASDDDRDWVQKIRAYLRENYGEKYPTLVNMASYGLLGGIGINAGSRVGVGDFLGDNGMKQTRTEMLLGSSTTLGSTAMQTIKQLMNGNYVEALKAINPSVGNVATAYKGEVRTTRGRLKYTYADNYERFIRALGFTPVGETLASEQASEDYFKRQEEQAEKQAAIDEFIAHPTPANAKTLNDLGITPKSLKTERERKNKTSHEINQEKEKKKKEKEKKIQKKKVYLVNDYQKAVNDYQKEK